MSRASVAFSQAAEKATDALDAVEKLAWDLPDEEQVSDEAIAALKDHKAKLGKLVEHLTQKREAAEARVTALDEQLGEVESLIEAIDATIALFTEEGETD